MDLEVFKDFGFYSDRDGKALGFRGFRIDRIELHFHVILFLPSTISVFNYLLRIELVGQEWKQGNKAEAYSNLPSGEGGEKWSDFRRQRFP